MNSQSRGVSIPWLVVALVVWFVSARYHQEGVIYAGQLFAWAKQPGTLTEAGGTAGMAALERGMAAVFGSFALAMLAGLVVVLRKVDPARIKRELVPWAAWAVLLVMIWKVFIVYATELVHFGQYALVGALVAFALDRGRLPVAAFLVTAGLGILPFLTWQRLSRSDGGAGLPDTSLAVKPVLIVFGLITLPLAFLDPQDLTHLWGYYIDHPYWGEYDNNKPTHWPGPREGAPLVMAVVLILATLLEPKRRQLSQGAIGVLLALALFAIQPPSRQEGSPVTRRVPYAGAVHTDGQPPVIDGKLDDPTTRSRSRRRTGSTTCSA